MQETVIPDPKDRLSIEDIKAEGIPTGLAITVLIAGCLLICVIIVLNVVLQTPLFILGLNFIY